MGGGGEFGPSAPGGPGGGGGVRGGGGGGVLNNFSVIMPNGSMFYNSCQRDCVCQGRENGRGRSLNLNWMLIYTDCHCYF
jgi:hypothetical protein